MITATKTPQNRPVFLGKRFHFRNNGYSFSLTSSHMKYSSRAATLAVTSLSHLQDLNWAMDYSLSTKELKKPKLYSLEITNYHFGFCKLPQGSVWRIWSRSSQCFHPVCTDCSQLLYPMRKIIHFYFIRFSALKKTQTALPIFQRPLFLTTLISERLLAEDVKSDASKYWY